jgi:hypothetical protein
MKRWLFGFLSLGLSLPLSVHGFDFTAKMKTGDVALSSAGQIAFAPDGILLVADPWSATIAAIATGDISPASSEVSYAIDQFDEKIAAALGTAAKDIQIVDIATNPISRKVYVSVARGRGPDAMAALLRVKADGTIEEVPLKSVQHSLAKIPNPAPDQEGRRGNPRNESITDIAYINGKVFVAGLSNEEFASNLRTIEFPFSEIDSGSSVEIYHGAHGKQETHSPVRTFAAYSIDGQEHLLAAYICTPLVKIPVNALQPGQKVRGVTVAELGNRNRPLDMVVYTKDGKDYVLMANSARGLMKITTDNIATIEAIESRVSDKAGLTYETIDSLKGVEQLDRLSDTRAVVLSRSSPEAPANLLSIALP